MAFRDKPTLFANREWFKPSLSIIEVKRFKNMSILIAMTRFISIE
jgi:hypothetical protein